jgi:hypothetical protein
MLLGLYEISYSKNKGFPVVHNYKSSTQKSYYFLGEKKAPTLLQMLVFIRFYVVGDTWIEHVTPAV